MKTKEFKTYALEEFNLIAEMEKNLTESSEEIEKRKDFFETAIALANKVEFGTSYPTPAPRDVIED